MTRESFPTSETLNKKYYKIAAGIATMALLLSGCGERVSGQDAQQSAAEQQSAATVSETISAEPVDPENEREMAEGENATDSNNDSTNQGKKPLSEYTAEAYKAEDGTVVLYDAIFGGTSVYCEAGNQNPAECPVVYNNKNFVEFFSCFVVSYLLGGHYALTSPIVGGSNLSAIQGMPDCEKGSIELPPKSAFAEEFSKGISENDFDPTDFVTYYVPLEDGPDAKELYYYDGENTEKVMCASMTFDRTRRIEPSAGGVQESQKVRCDRPSLKTK